MNETKVTALMEQIKELNQEMVQLSEQKLSKTTNGGDAKLTLFRQQAAIIGRKKEAAASKLAQVNEELSKLMEDKDSQKSTKSTKVKKGLKGFNQLSN